MKHALLILLCAGVSAPSPVVAEVKTASSDHFQIIHVRDFKLPADQVFSAIKAVDKWWDTTHSYFEDKGRFYIELKPGGCLCEVADGASGFVQHMLVAAVIPQTMHIQLVGSLGPLKSMALSGTMDWMVQAKEGGGSQFIWRYRVTGGPSSDLDSIAKPVDGALLDQVNSFAAYVAETTAN